MTMMMKKTELAQQKVVQSENGIVGDMNGEKVMLGLHTGKYYNLGKVGGRIWELLSEPIAVSRLIDELVQEYEIDRPACEREVAEFLQQLHREALIEACGLES